MSEDKERNEKLREQVINMLKEAEEIGLIDEEFIDDLAEFLLQGHIEIKVGDEWVIVQEGRMSKDEEIEKKELESWLKEKGCAISIPRDIKDKFLELLIFYKELYGDILKSKGMNNPLCEEMWSNLYWACVILGLKEQVIAIECEEDLRFEGEQVKEGKNE